MTAKIIETLELLEEKIEDIKWLLAQTSSYKVNLPHTLSAIRKSAGILHPDYPKGIAVENKLRKEWRLNSILVTRNTKHFSNIKEIQIQTI